ncbi:hypothetical protein [Neobacillus sp. DY30]|uniref:hypothetical protein n=1 Tax=Neobacillus sp. DY30 TaxID=3047871 RepID=UPI0024BF6474|nr:hypothetical protein [Neobacillus sp. DY30]WHY01815.1 hypothetical protein QNH29_06200 [Neobacillus sp. DY30]
MREGEEFEFEIPADHGDLVTVDGYDGRFFMVIGYQLIRNCLPEEAYNEVVYEVLDAVTGEFLEADGEDVEFVTDADHASAYLAENPPEYNEPLPAVDLSDWMIDISNYTGGVTNMAKSERKPTPRELSAKEAEERKAARNEREAQINNLLEIAQWNRKMLDKTNDESYGDRLFAVEAELMKLVDND